MDFYYVYRIDGCDYDEYDAAVVVAESKEDAIAQIIATGHCYGNHKYDNLFAEKIDPEKGIVLESYNAG